MAVAMFGITSVTTVGPLIEVVALRTPVTVTCTYGESSTGTGPILRRKTRLYQTHPLTANSVTNSGRGLAWRKSPIPTENRGLAVAVH